MLYMDASIRTKRQENKPFWRRKKSKESYKGKYNIIW